MFEPVVDRVVLTFVFLTCPERDTVLVSFYDLDAVVGRTAVHHDVFEIRVGLVEDGANRRFQKCALIKRRRNNRNLGKGR